MIINNYFENSNIFILNEKKFEFSYDNFSFKSTCDASIFELNI